MTKVRVANLQGPALDWAAHKALGWAYPMSWIPGNHWYFSPSTKWEHGGPIFERLGANLFKHNGGTEWCCACYAPRDGVTTIFTADGPTPLIATMRCLVTSRLGEWVDIPEELCNSRILRDAGSVHDT